VPQSWLLEEDSRNQGERVAEEATHRMQQSIKRAAVPCGELHHQIREAFMLLKKQSTHTFFLLCHPSRIASSRLVINLLLTCFSVHVNPNFCFDLLFSLSLSLSLFNTWQFPIAII
jgi:hypothetical protein